MEFSPRRATHLREALGLNRVVAARMIGLSRQGLVNIEDGESVPSANTVGSMASAYGIPVDSLFVHDENGTTPDGARALRDDENTPAPDAFRGKKSAAGAR